MKILHLSDLHIGKRVCEHPMIAEQRYIFDQILELMRVHEPQCVILAGDIYDKSVASAEAVTLFDSFLTALADRCECICAISGNHDSAERIAFGSRLLSSRGVYMSPVYNGTVEPLRLRDRHGTVNIYPLPFIKPATVRAALGTECESYEQAFSLAVNALGADPSERNVIAAHQYVAGAARCESEDTPIGGIDSVSAADLDMFDYAALGHLHSAQKVGRDTVRYCGSPLKYSISEINSRKSAVLVDLEEKGNTTFTLLPLEPMHDMRALRGRFAELARGSSEDFVHITLTDELDVPDAASRLRQIYPRLLRLDYDNARTRALSSAVISQARSMPPIELLAALYERQNGTAMDELQTELARKLIEKTWGDVQ